ncbi:hypothetical protein UVI_02016500 [Ustilaginoidea virens]|uniref:Meiotically up-regulated protein Msb1/Mug8 domain-containing protein n=1 Tax=Ustilaginoidea virens TaxID=1159556 RepID=A0A1B5KU69_USTVR|nr:hypothetical protein UVI_02016500 [Ustilaginoidea virens]
MATDSHMARDSFKTFIPLSVDSGSRQRIIFDFFELVAAIAAHGKTNGFGGRLLPRLAAWWAFEHKDTGTGFDGGYRSWKNPEEGLTGITMLPRSLEKLLNETEYPPGSGGAAAKLMSRTNKIVMLVDSVSPTPFALLRRAGHFQYRDSDPVLQEFSEHEDPVQALTEECLRVLRAISATNESQASSIKHSTSLRDASWSRFQDIGFAETVEEEVQAEGSRVPVQEKHVQSLRSTAASATDLGRPSTPSWADFLSSGFVDEGQNPSNLLLPPDKVLPPIETQVRQQSSQSHRPRLESNPANLQPGELASITVLDLDNAFWWVWMNSLGPEETSSRKSAFGRCAIIETRVGGGHWLVMEEMIAGSAPEQDGGAYIAEKKGLFSWTRRGRSMGRRKSVGKHILDRGDKGAANSASTKASVGPDTHARIQAKAAQMRAAVKESEQHDVSSQTRRGRTDDSAAEKTTSVLTLQPQIVGEASSALKWVSKYDKGTIKDAYMANSNAGRGLAVPYSPTSEHMNGNGVARENGHAGDRDRPVVPAKDESVPATLPVARGSKPLQESQEQQQQQQQQQQPMGPEKKTPADGQPAEHQAGDERDVAAADATSNGAGLTSTAAQTQSTDSAPGATKQQDAAPAKDKKGLLNLLRRKNRSSKIPENAAAQLSSMMQNNASATDEPVQRQVPSSPKHVAPVASPLPEQVTTAASAEPILEDHSSTIVQPTYDPPVGGQSYADDAADVDEEFARFDQGPLVEQPALVPQEEEQDATPRPAAPSPVSSPEGGKEPRFPEPIEKEKLNQSAGPGVQDRWAQIRKNAAQRASTRQREEMPRLHKAACDDDDASVEETIESRVARIKARVAELTGDMDTGNGSLHAMTSRS